MIGLLRRLFNNGFVTFCIIVVTFTELGGNKMHTSFGVIEVCCCKTPFGVVPVKSLMQPTMRPPAPHSSMNDCLCGRSNALQSTILADSRDLFCGVAVVVGGPGAK